MNALAQYRASLTPETLQANLDAARKASAEKILVREANKHLYKTTSLDTGHWHMLASKHSVRMPHADEPVTMKSLRKYLKRCNVLVETFNEHYTSMSYFLQNNSTWTAFGAAGLILELKEGM